MRHRRRLSTLIPLAILLAWLIFLRPTFLYGDTSYIIVMGRSMEPTLKQGDLAVLKRAESYSVGDILGYVTPYGPRVIHRIVATKGDAFTLKGDNHTSVDPWDVTQDMVLGKLLFSIPYVGAVFNFLKEPFRLAATIAVLFLVSSIPLSEPAKRRKPKFRTAHGWISKRIIALVLLAVLLAVSGYGVFYVQRLPTERTRFVELYRYGHVGTFDYSVELKPSILYNKTTIGPGEVIYVNLAHTMDVHFHYEFNCTRPADVSGSYSVHMDLELPKEWVKRFILVSDVPFNSEGFSFSHQLNITSISELIHAIERETATRAPAYNLKITPEVHISAMVGGDLIEEDFSPSMVITFTGSRLTVEGLEHAKPNIVGQTKVEPALWNLYGIPILVSHLRYLSYAALAGLSVAMVWAAYYKRVEPKGVAERIRRKYGDLIADLREAPRHAETPTVIQIASIEDLVKIADSLGKPILHSKKEQTHVFYVLNADVRYEFTAEEIAELEKNITKEKVKSSRRALTPLHLLRIGAFAAFIWYFYWAFIYEIFVWNKPIWESIKSTQILINYICSVVSVLLIILSTVPIRLTVKPKHKLQKE